MKPRYNNEMINFYMKGKGDESLLAPFGKTLASDAKSYKSIIKALYGAERGKEDFEWYREILREGLCSLEERNSDQQVFKQLLYIV